MATFWLWAALFIVIALVFSVAPLLWRPRADKEIDQKAINLSLYQRQLGELAADVEAGTLDEAAYEVAKSDLQKSLLIDVSDDPSQPQAPAQSGRWIALVLVTAMPLLAISLYQILGSPIAIDQGDPRTADQARQQPGVAGNALPSMEELVAKLAQKLEQAPDNLEGWLMLARSYQSLEQPQKALAAFERALTLAPQDENIMLAVADALATLQDNSFAGRPDELIEQAAEINPDNPSVLWMQGLTRYTRKDLKGSLEYWERLYGQLDQASEDAQSLLEYINTTREEAGLPQLATRVAEGTEETAQIEPATASGVQVRVHVTLGADLQQAVDPQDTLFVYAKAQSGPPMPLAVQRLLVADLPVSVSLDDSMAMMPQMRLSAFDQVIVGARVSKTGNAMPQPGDLFTEQEQVSPAQSPEIRLVIDQTRP